MVWFVCLVADDRSSSVIVTREAFWPGEIQVAFNTEGPKKHKSPSADVRDSGFPPEYADDPFPIERV